MASSGKAQKAEDDPKASALLAIEEALNCRASGQGTGPAEANPIGTTSADKAKGRLERLLGELDEPDLERFAAKGLLAKEDLERLLGELGEREAATSRRAFRSSTDDLTRWFVTLFPVSAGAFVIGLLSALYIVLAGFSTIALAGAYLIPLGLTALYYLLGAAERRAS